MKAPTVYIPNGLHQVHPGLEQAFKSISLAVTNLSQANTATASAVPKQQVYSLTEQVSALSTAVSNLQEYVDANLNSQSLVYDLALMGA